MSARTIASYKKKWGEPGSKVTRKTTAMIFSAGRGRFLMVSVYPDGIIGVRMMGTRTEYFTRAEDAFRNAVVDALAAKRDAKKKARKFK